MNRHNELHHNLLLSEEILRTYLQRRNPQIALILGSGLNALAQQLKNPLAIPFEDIPFMKKSTAEGHVGQFVCGQLSGVEILCMQGRLHGYEGNTAQEVAYPVWLMNYLGIETLITTNAAGAVNEEFCVGDFCVMSDQINFTGRNPIAELGPAKIAERFFSMNDAFDFNLRKIACKIADQLDIRLHEGIYLGLLGPSFETPAEIRMFRTWGADTLAMSVVEEVIAARHVGMKVLGISLITNMAAGIKSSSPNGEEVLEVGKQSENTFLRLMSGIIRELK